MFAVPTDTEGLITMAREATHPTLNERGDEEHPAFAVIGAYRGSSTPGQVLFDSDILHRGTVTIRISRATRHRDLHRDWIHGNTAEIVEVEMSEAQWATFVSSMNSGSGVPCTLRRTETDWNIPGLFYDPRLAHSMDEVKEGAARTFRRVKEAMEEYDALDSKATAKEKRQALAKVRNAIANIEANLSFAAESLTEHAENVVQRARADIEAMVTAQASRLGLTSADTEGMLELPQFAGEQS